MTCRCPDCLDARYEEAEEAIEEARRKENEKSLRDTVGDAGDLARPQVDGVIDNQPEIRIVGGS